MREKLVNIKSKVKNSPHEKRRESEVAGEAEFARFSKIRCNEFIYSLLDSNRT